MNFVINLNKPAHITSHKAVAKVKRLLGAQKAGHTGTLDPAATGVLLICLNEATKISRFLLNMDKQYQARIKLGERTDTYDAQGMIIEKRDISGLDVPDLGEVVQAFVGKIKQKPPMHSAVKYRGQPLYKLARKGIEIERAERMVHISEIRITGIDLPHVDFTVACSKGTYIRTLCDDIGLKLGTGAHLVSLERTKIGPFDIKDALSLDDLRSDRRCFYSIEEVLSEFREVHLAAADYNKARHGMHIPCHNYGNHAYNEFVRLKGPSGKLFAIGRVQQNQIRIERILNL